MPAVVSYQFKKGFILKQEHIIKLDEIIHNRLKELCINDSIYYKIHMADLITYDTQNFEDVINEENSQRNKILELFILLKNDKLTIKLLFDEEGIKLYIEAENKKYALLIYTDIKSYIETEIATIKPYKCIAPILLTCTGICLALSLSLLFVNFNIDYITEAADKAIKGGVEEKLNFLIEEKIPRYKKASTILYILPASMIFFIFSICINHIVNFVQRKNIFCWGKMEANYNNFLKNRSRIFWGIIIAGLITIVGGVLANLLSKIVA